jgi:hypothetical protein
VATLVEALEALVPGIEQELKPRLSGFLGGIVRAYLPQHWTFETDRETATATIEKTGDVHVASGPVSAPDVTVKGPHDRLLEVLTSHSRPAGKVEGIDVRAHTAKGRAALEQVRQRFGF